MPDSKPTAPLDLSLFDDLDSSHAPPLTAPLAAQPAVAADPKLAPEPEPERLLDIANLSREDLAAAEAAAAKIDFRNTNTLLSHGEGVLGGIAQASRQLLTGGAARGCWRGRAHSGECDRRREDFAHPGSADRGRRRPGRLRARD